MTAWVKRGTKEEVGIVTDNTDPELVCSYGSSRLFATRVHQNIHL